MLDILIGTIFLAVIAGGLLGSRSGSEIARTPYNNVYSDAAAARQDHLG
ncbi:MAG TPA: hypothetical protein VGD00_03510 [Solirubrobacteraceae bacterium]|jgi:hypothetical protein